MNRRSFIAALFAGTVVPSSAMPVDQEYYTAAPDVYNVWQIRNKFWYLLLDSDQAPLEFASSSDATNFCKSNRLEEYPYALCENPQESWVKYRRAPTELHPMDYIRMDAASADAFLDRNQITDEFHRLLVREMLMGQSGAEQSATWVWYLDQKQFKQKILQLQSCPEFCLALRNVYCRNSYHSVLAKLEVFCPPYVWR